MTIHIITFKPSGAECSCGKDFNIWAWPRTMGYNANRMKGLACAQAKRHADAQNKKEK